MSAHLREPFSWGDIVFFVFFVLLLCIAFYGLISADAEKQLFIEECMQDNNKRYECEALYRGHGRR